MKKFFIYFGLIFLILVCGALFGGKLYLKQSLINYNGIIKSEKIKENVEIYFDKKGIPQIFAENENDLFFALGYVHSAERLFQMELFRRMSYGTLSEVFGEIAYSTDLTQRKIGFSRIAKKDGKTIPPHLKSILESYCAGINHYIEKTTVLPPEFVILNFKPEKWKPIDCLTIGLYQTWYSHALMDNDKAYNSLIKKFNGDLRELLKEYKSWSPPTVSDSFLEQLKKNNSFPFRMAEASNSWVVAPSKSKSGHAIHCSDPHLDISSIPNFWYIAGLHLKDKFNFVGITAASLPLGLMGHNDNIAFAFTVASVDIIDYFKFEKNKENQLEIKTSNGYEKIEIVKEYIKIKGVEKPKEEIIKVTNLGPVIEEDKNSVTCLKWAGFDFNCNKLIESGIDLFYAKNFQDFRNAVTNVGALDANWTYSDKSGNIGYQLGVPIPKRKFSNTFEIQNGENTNWDGYYNIEEKPFSFNPKENFIATCNNQIVSNNWPYELPGFYAKYRIIEINRLLNSKEKFTKEELANFQQNQVSGQAKRWKKYMKNGAVLLKNNSLAKDIENWDCEMNINSKVAALYLVWKQYFAKNIFEDDFKKNYKKGKSIFDLTVESNIKNIIDNKNTEKKESIDEISSLALKEALNIVDDKTLGDLSFHSLKHPLSQVKILDKILHLNRGPFKKGGDKTTLNANFNSYNFEKNKFSTFVGASMRFVLDWSNPDNFSIYTNLGQSGNPFSENYDSFLEIWQKGKSWNVPITKKEIMKKAKNKLTILNKN